MTTSSIRARCDLPDKSATIKPMNLLEYEAKKLLGSYDIPVPEGQVIKDLTASVETPVVLKSQVPTGGRGKLGGIKIVEDQADVDNAIKHLFQTEIKGFLPQTLLAEEKLDIKRELYLSILINRSKSCIEIVAHTNGGTEVEENELGTFLEIPLEDSPTTIHGEHLAEYYGLESQVFILQDFIKNLYRAFVESDATLIEINPLVLTADNRLLAGDGKITLDDAAKFRHPEWDFETATESVNFVTLNEQGTVATIANGAGLAMATVDAVANKGLAPANFLDIGGGANAESALVAFGRIQEFPNIKAIVINIFAGITRCDEVAKAIIAAKSEINNLPPLFIRLAGTNYQAAEALLNEQNIPLLPTLERAIEATLEVVHE